MLLFSSTSRALRDQHGRQVIMITIILNLIMSQLLLNDIYKEDLMIRYTIISQ